MWVDASTQVDSSDKALGFVLRFVYWRRTELTTFSSQHPVISAFKSELFPLALLAAATRNYLPPSAEPPGNSTLS